MSKTLPECRWRASVAGHIRCRHEKVHATGTLHPSACLRCRWVDAPCENPREFATDGSQLVPAARPDKGLGDTVHRLLVALGIRKQCGGCRKRQAWLNKVVPYR